MSGTSLWSEVTDQIKRRKIPDLSLHPDCGDSVMSCVSPLLPCLSHRDGVWAEASPSSFRLLLVRCFVTMTGKLTNKEVQPSHFILLLLRRFTYRARTDSQGLCDRSINVIYYLDTWSWAVALSDICLLRNRCVSEITKLIIYIKFCLVFWPRSRFFSL